MHYCTFEIPRPTVESQKVLHFILWYGFKTCFNPFLTSWLIIWMSPFVVLGVSSKCFHFLAFFTEIPASKQCRPWSDAAFCGVWTGSALFAHVAQNVYSKMSLLRPPNIKTTSLLRPVFESPQWYFPYDIIFDIKTTSLIRPLLGSPKGGLNIGILLYMTWKGLM